LEPMMFTFTFFSQETKNNSNAWWPLGYVNDLDVMSSAQKASQHPGQAMWDYHSIMATILSSFICIQDEGHFPFEFPFGDLGMLNLKFPVPLL
jgi:hypothetical protein